MQPQCKGHVHEMIVTEPPVETLTTAMLFFYYQVAVIHVLFTVHWVHVNCPFPSPSAAHSKGAAGSLVVIASAYHLCSVHVLCVCVLFVITCCVYPACLCGSVLCDQEHTFHP